MKKIFYAFIILFLISNECFAASETAESIYAKAYSYIYKNNTKTAISHFKTGLTTYPDCAFLYAGMGDAYLKEGNYKKAMEAYTTAQRSKYAIDIYKLDFYNASIQENIKNINSALNEIIPATKYSENPILYKNIKYIMNENYNKLEVITDIYTENSNITDINSLPDKDTELKKYLEALSANPTDFTAANNAGVILIYLKDYQLAEKYLKQALENNQNSAMILNNLAIASMYQKKYTEMDDYFSRALKENPNYGPAINNKAVAKIKISLSQYQTQNINSILDVAQKDNKNYYAWKILSQIYMLKGEYKNASKLLNDFNSDYNSKLYYQKSYIDFKNNNYSNALINIDKAISIYPNNSVYYVLKGRILAETSDYTSAKSNFLQALQRDKKNQHVNYYLAQAIYKSGKPLLAINSIKEFITQKKGNAESTQLNLLLDK